MQSNRSPNHNKFKSAPLTEDVRLHANQSQLPPMPKGKPAAQLRPEPLNLLPIYPRRSEESEEGYESADRNAAVATGLPSLHIQCHTPLLIPSSPHDFKVSTTSVQHRQLSSQTGMHFGVTNRKATTASFDDVAAAFGTTNNTTASPFIGSTFNIAMATPSASNGMAVHSRTPSTFDGFLTASQTPVVPGQKRGFSSFPKLREQWQQKCWNYCCFILCCSLGETRQTLTQKWSRATRLRVNMTRIARILAAIFVISVIHTNRRLFLSLPLQLAGQCPLGAVLERSDMGKLYTAAGSTANAQKGVTKGTGIASDEQHELRSGSQSKSLGKIVADVKEERKDEIPLHQLRKLQNNGVRLSSMDELSLSHLRSVPHIIQRSAQGSNFDLQPQWTRRNVNGAVTLEMDLMDNIKHHAVPFPLLMRRVSYTLSSDGQLEIDKLISRGGWAHWLTDSNQTSTSSSADQELSSDLLLDLKVASPQVASPYLDDERKLLAYQQHRERAVWWRKVKSQRKRDMVQQSKKRKSADKPSVADDPHRSYEFSDLFNPQHILSQGIWRRHRSMKYQTRMNFEYVDATGVPIFEKYLRNADEKFRIDLDMVDVKRANFNGDALELLTSSTGTTLSLKRMLKDDPPALLLKLAPYSDIHSEGLSLPSTLAVTWGGKQFHDARNMNKPPAPGDEVEMQDEGEITPFGDGGDVSRPSSSGFLSRWWSDLGKAMNNFHGVRYYVRSGADEADMQRADASLSSDGAPTTHYRTTKGTPAVKWQSLLPIPNMGLVEHIGGGNRNIPGAAEGDIVDDDSHAHAIVPRLDQPEIARKKAIYLKHLAKSSYVIPIQERKVPLVIVQTNQNMVVPSGMRDATERLLRDNPEFSYEYFSDADMDNFVALYFGDTHDSEDEELLGPEDSSKRKDRMEKARALADEINILFPAWMRDQSTTAARSADRQRKHHPIAQAYFSLIPGAYRADLFRYLYLYLFGGVYIDMGMSPPAAASYSPYSAYTDICSRHKENAQIQNSWANAYFGTASDNVNSKSRSKAKRQLLKTPQSFCPGPLFSLLRPEDTFISAEDSREGLVYNAFMMAAPAHPILKSAIVMSVNKILAKYWVLQTKSNNAALSVTGPKLLAEAFKEVTKRAPEPNVNYGKGVRLVSYWRYNACLSGAIESEVDVRAELMIYENRDLLEYDRRSGKAKAKEESGSATQTDLILRATVPEDMEPDVQRIRTLLFTKYESYYHDSRFYHLFPHYGILYGAKKIYRDGDSRKL